MPQFQTLEIFFDIFLSETLSQIFLIDPIYTWLQGNTNTHEIVPVVYHKRMYFFSVLSFIFIFPRSHYLKKMASAWTTCVDDIPTVYLHYSQTERKVK